MAMSHQHPDWVHGYSGQRRGIHKANSKLWGDGKLQDCSGCYSAARLDGRPWQLLQMQMAQGLALT